jgi:hypothetical protein
LLLCFVNIPILQPMPLPQARLFQDVTATAVATTNNTLFCPTQNPQQLNHNSFAHPHEQLQQQPRRWLETRQPQIPFHNSNE